MSKKLSELVIELRAESKQFTSTLQKSQVATQRASKAMARSVDKFAKSFFASVSSFQRVLETSVGFMSGQTLLNAFGAIQNAAQSLFRTLVSDGVVAAQMQEDSVHKLNTALATTGEFSRATSQEIQVYASSL